MAADSRRLRLSEAIEGLAQRTSASEEFVAKIRRVFEAKGISLDCDAAPFARALSDAFHQQAALRRTIQEARESLTRIQTGAAHVGQTFSSHLERLQALRELLEEHRRRMGSGGHREREAARRRTRMVRGDVDRAVVPGPDGLQ
jgi:hypothetical protein